MTKRTDSGAKDGRSTGQVTNTAQMDPLHHLLGGWGGPCQTVAEAVGKTVQTVLKDRLRYDGDIDAVYPSPEEQERLRQEERKNRPPDLDQPSVPLKEN